MYKYLKIYCCNECNYIKKKVKAFDICLKATAPTNVITAPNNIPDWCPLPERTQLPNGTVLSLTDERVVSLYDKEGYKTGEINFSEKHVTFSGHLDKSSETLFSLLKYIIDPFFKDK